MSMIMGLLSFSLSVFIVAMVLPSVRVRSYGSALGVAVIYGVLKFFLHWLLILVSLPFIIITLGLFLIVINAFLLWLTDKLVDGFEIDSIFSTIVASVLISVLDIVLRWVLPWV
ncbi:MAG: phage holin family protein [Candidatus Latescibacteria bacterium]|nr:phage holin family protein [Candidatus Latescibacterota bacterium]MBT4138641.1 phage holin family protein [Candidatus Latescibacterota bacterium]MBT5830470.1 phage holin family protein [Candidatus Latescibacterota bacterium]